MALYPVSGCKFSIGTALDTKTTDFTAADFSSITWQEVAKWTQMGDIGDAAQLITTQVISQGRDEKQAGTKNAGSMQNIFAELPGDLGQAALIAQAGSPQNLAFKIELNDKPSAGASPKNGLRYFIGLVLTAMNTGGGANTVRNLSSTIEINSNIVRVAPSAT